MKRQIMFFVFLFACQNGIALSQSLNPKVFTDCTSTCALHHFTGGVQVGYPSIVPDVGQLGVEKEIKLGSGTNHMIIEEGKIYNSEYKDIIIGDVLNLHQAGKVLEVLNKEALWFNGDYFSWGFGGNYNRFADGIHIGGVGAPPSRGLKVDGKALFSTIWAAEGIAGPTAYFGSVYAGTMLAAKEIHTDELHISPDWETEVQWPDYVFSKDYNLMKLSDVEAYIERNGHLPEIPSANEVMRNGISVAETSARLLQKVEELTLYVIEQQKQNDEQNAEIVALKKRLTQLPSLEVQN